MALLSDAGETRCPAGAGRKPGGCRAAARVESYKKKPRASQAGAGRDPGPGLT